MIVEEMNRVWATHPSGHQPREEYQQKKEAYYSHCRNLCEHIRQANEQEIFDALFWFACSKHEFPKATADFAAHLLYYIKPACPLPCYDAVRAVVLSYWNVSVEEVPWYLAEFFGAERIYQELDKLEQEDFVQEARAKRKAWEKSHSHLRTFAEWKTVWENPLDGDVGGGLDAIRYWLDGFVSDSFQRRSQWAPPWE